MHVCIISWSHCNTLLLETEPGHSLAICIRAFMLPLQLPVTPTVAFLQITSLLHVRF
jgi:hypothetical protein